MDHVFEGLLGAIGVAVVPAAILGFILAAIIDKLRDDPDSSTTAWCVGGLVVVGLLIALYLHGKAQTCPPPPGYGRADFRETVCHLVRPQPDVPSFPSSGG